MTGHERAGYRSRLQNLLRRVGATVHELRDERSGGAAVETLTDAGDVGAHEYDEQTDFALAGAEEHVLSEVEAALARIEASTFGTCTACGRPVGEDRLQAVPYVRLCAGCARQKETARR